MTLSAVHPIDRVDLRFAVDDRAAAFAAPMLDAHAIGEARDAIVEDVVFDAADIRLLDAGYATRVRSVGEERALIVKGPGDLAPFGKREWRGPAPAAAPGAADLPAAAAKVAGDAALLPIFRIRFRRQARRVRIEESVVELRLDDGEIQAGGIAAPIADLELALIEGAPARLFELALTLQATHPLRLIDESKIERGRALVRGAGLAAPAPVFAGAIGLRPGDSVGAALDPAFASCLRQMAGNVACASAGRDPEGVHQMRVAIRRMRAAIGGFRGALPPALATTLTDDLRALMDALAPARDLDVFLDETLAPILAARPQDRALQALRGAAELARTEAYDDVRAALTTSGPTRIALLGHLWRAREADRRARKAVARKRLKAAKKAASRSVATPDGVAGPPAPQDEPAAIAPAAILPKTSAAARENPAAFGDALDAPAATTARLILDKRLRQAARTGRNYEALAVPQLHDLRLRLKKLRYAAEFFADLFPVAGRRPFIKPLKALQDRLGLLQDAVVAEDLGARMAERAARSARTGVKTRATAGAAAIAVAQPMVRPADLAHAAGLIAGWRGALAETDAAKSAALWRALTAAKPFWR